MSDFERNLTQKLFKKPSSVSITIIASLGFFAILTLLNLFINFRVLNSLKIQAYNAETKEIFSVSLSEAINQIDKNSFGYAVQLNKSILEQCAKPPVETAESAGEIKIEPIVEEGPAEVPVE